MEFKRVKFIPDEKTDFFKVLRSRVEEYFNENNLQKTGNYKMYIKTVLIASIYFLPYISLYVFDPQNIFVYLFHWLLMGVGMAGCGLSIMHDAAHGAYSKNKYVNNFLAHSLNVLGGNALNWKLQHNVLHHSYTNIDGLDEDLNPGAFMRFSPHREYKKIYKWQFVYAWILYGFMTFMWVSVKDFNQLARFRRYGILKGEKKFKNELIKILVSKVVYFTYTIALPVIFLSTPFWWVLVGMFILHFTASLILSCIFQPAHIMETSIFPQGNEEGRVENKWAIHQLQTTSNFASKSVFFSWFVGGLNYQIEHHLFPTICHIHYKDLSKIVKKTASEYNLPYHDSGAFVVTLWEHAKMLKKLGKPNFA